ncbi:DNA gyrase subunit A [Candidatus Microgenomates bacterium]|nr:DNA gyrase subunit A [Candidatus Microgenomates bacterium]
MSDIGKIQAAEITQEMQRSYLDYAMSVIVSRALPDVRDGLKPVHRRILYAMHQMGLSHAAKYTKSAKIVGEVLGKYHPHGDMPVYDALVRLAQDFSMRYALVDGQGNYGSVDGDPPAAMRYTEARLTAIAQEMLLDLEKETVDFVPNFDSTLKEPVFLPAKLPNLLLMGSEGIAVGMATKIPPHNLGEVIDAITFMIGKANKKAENKMADKTDQQAKENNEISAQSSLNFDVSVEDLMQFIKGPDFPTGAAIYDISEITAAYATGKGKIIMRAKAEIEDIGQGKSAIIVTELPYQVNKAQLVAKIAELAKDKKVEGISDLRDESDRHGIRVVVELKRDTRPRTVLQNLFKHTAMQTTFPVNLVALVEGTPQTLTLKMVLEKYIDHRRQVIVRRSEFELKEAKARLHILEGLKIAVDHIDEVIETIKKSKDADEAKGKLMERFGLSVIQATAILDMQLRRLAALERQKIEDEYEMVKETIAYLEDLLAHPEKILDLIKSELLKVREKYVDERKTRVYKSKPGEFSEEDLIPKENVVITLSQSGYIKRQSLNTFNIQQRGGKGVMGMKTKEGDEIDHILSASTHDNILFFTNKGKVYQMRVWDVPEGTRISKGQAIVNIINIEQGEMVSSILTYPSDTKGEGKYIFLTTEKGTVKKTELSEYTNIRRTGLITIKLDKDDELCWTKLTSGKDDVILVTHDGKSIRFNENQVRPTKRDTMGVRGILCGKDDYVIGMDIVKSEKDELLVIMEKGLGKKTTLSEFPKQSRGGKGVKACETTQRTGKVITSHIIEPNCDSIILTSVNGQVVKMPISSVPKLSRATQGVILMRFSDPKDSLAAATCLTKEK